MNITGTVDSPGFESALARSVKALSRLARYEIEPSIQARMQDLGERKEFLSESEHTELTSLVEFTEHRTVERLEAEAALRQLHEFVPQLVEAT